MTETLVPLGSLVLGFLVTRLIVTSMSAVLEANILMRRNYRDRPIATARGLAIVFAVLVVESVRTALGGLGIGTNEVSSLRNVVLLTAIGYGFLGFIDDCLAEGTDRGFRGHLAAAAHGRITSGMLKLLGGGAMAFVLVATAGFPDGRRLIIDGALIALSANAGNVFDRAPGRTVKVSVLLAIPVAVLLGEQFGPVAIVIGAAIAMLPEERTERAMLGDTGANPLGAVLAVGVVFGGSEMVRIGTLIFVLVVNLAAERWSFSAVIERSPLLRWLDGIGQSQSRRDWVLQRAKANTS